MTRETTMPPVLVDGLLKPCEQALDDLVQEARDDKGSFDDLVKDLYRWAEELNDRDYAYMRFAVTLALAVQRLSSAGNGVPK